ncbi:adhesin [Metallibacterium sp.]|uniref:adhesin n=1 Tax=Metallibacterium sp. TaxID=2940281 RepID=UPI0026199BFF|nr:adhesin [Metallibacterium sp.]
MRNLKKNLLALAVLAATGIIAPAAFAQEGPSCGGTCTVNTTVNYTLDEQDWIRNYLLNSVSYIYSDVVYDENVDVNSDTSIRRVRMNKDLSLLTDVSITGNPTVSGTINTDSAAIAVVDNRQHNVANDGENYLLANDASIADDAAQNAQGNIGLNVAAGDNNQQHNAAALAAADASFAFTMADSEVFVEQLNANNTTGNFGQTNTANLGGNALQNATGNIGVNIAAGNNNQQQNNLVASTGTNSMATASVNSKQDSGGNYTLNEGYTQRFVDLITINLTGTVYGSGAEGQVLGTSTGTSDQRYNMYPDNWGKAPGETPTSAHPTNGPWLGHTDWDTHTQGTDINDNPIVRTPGNDPMDPSNDGGSLVMNNNDEISLEEMSAQLSGYVVDYSYVAVMSSNSASLNGSALQNAQGNIGVNIASGTGNQQANSLALAVTQASSGGGGSGGAE